MADNPKVFISYAHDDKAFADKIFHFAKKLRDEGIDATIDQYEDSPPEGWPRWMENHIKQSGYVLIVCTQLYQQKCYEIDNKKGKGVSWEVMITYQHLYDAYSNNIKFIPIVFDNADEQFVPTPIKGATIYNVSDSKRFDELYWRLRGVKKTEKPPLGTLKPLPEKPRKRIMFYSSQINIELWNKAKWCGMLYMFTAHTQSPPIICFMFENYDAGKMIFTEWMKYATTLDNQLDIAFIEPPFPLDSIVHTDSSHSKGKGYFIHVSSNIDGALARMEKQVGISEETLLVTVSRYHWMQELNGTHNRQTFKQLFKRFGKCYIAPVHVKDINRQEDIIFDENSKIAFSNVRFISGNELDESDIAIQVLGEKYKAKIYSKKK